MSPREHHPYGNFIPIGAKAMIIGSFPIGKFTKNFEKGKIDLSKEMDFYYGGARNSFWKLVGLAWGMELKDPDTIRKVLTKKGIGITDVISSCIRLNGSGLDRDLKDVEWNTELQDILLKHQIKTLIFTSKTVKKWFEKHIAPTTNYEVITLLSASGVALISVASSSEYKEWLKTHPGKRPGDYRIEKYREALKI